jgi:hypothetical protein
MAHANKHIREALKYAAYKGWNVVEGGGHAWGKIYCEHGHADCWMMIWSTPRTPENHAKRIRKVVDACPGADDTEGSS